MKADERALFKRNCAAFAQHVAKITEGMKTPKPVKFPMKFKDFLKRAFKGRLYSERLHLFRKFLISQYCNNHVNPEIAASDLIATLVQTGIKNPMLYYKWILEIAHWRVSNRIQQRRQAAKSRWIKEKSKKSLGADSNSQK